MNDIPLESVCEYWTTLKSSHHYNLENLDIFRVKKDGVFIVPFRGLKVGFVPLRVFNLKRFIAGAFVIPLRVLS